MPLNLNMTDKQAVFLQEVVDTLQPTGSTLQRLKAAPNVAPAFSSAPPARGRSRPARRRPWWSDASLRRRMQ